MKTIEHLEVVEYLILSAVSGDELAEKVNAMIQDGWQPHGSIGVSSGTMQGYFMLHQPMVQYAK